MPWPLRLLSADGGSNRAPSRPGTRVAGQVDEFENGAVRVVEIGARPIQHSAPPILLEDDLDAMGAQMVKRRGVLVMRHGKGVVHAAVAVLHRIDRRRALD